MWADVVDGTVVGGWLPEDRLVWTVLGAVGEMDVRRSGNGCRWENGRYDLMRRKLSSEPGRELSSEPGRKLSSEPGRKLYAQRMITIEPPVHRAPSTPFPTFSTASRLSGSPTRDGERKKAIARIAAGAVWL